MDIRKIMTYTGLAILAAMFLGGAAAFAQAAAPTTVLISDAGLKALGIGVGLGLVVMGGGRGIGNIGSSATESIARQPEATNDIRGVGVLLAAFVEGIALFGVVVLLLVVFMVK